jgi:hypothetical protein
MRTIQEIKDSITTAVMNDATLCAAFGLDASARWEGQVSHASVLNLIIYIVAVAQHTLEWMFDTFKNDVEKRIAAALPGSVSWLWNRAMEYQDDLEANTYFNEHGAYESVDETKQIIAYASVLEEYNQVKIKVNKAGYAPLSATQLEQFTAYMERLKFAGVRLSVSSTQSDDLALTLRIWRNRLLMSTENTNAISDAVESYLNGIRYGGTFNKTRLMDAIQAVTGVDDVTIGSCVFTAHDSAATVTDIATMQNYKSIAGHINLQSLTVNYE